MNHDRAADASAVCYSRLSDVLKLGHTGIVLVVLGAMRCPDLAICSLCLPAVAMPGSGGPA